MAARSLTRRIAAERGWTIGREIGWQIRFERNFSRETRLLVATEGILTARLQGDPLLSDFSTVVLDEFHERSLHADLALALLRETLTARDDLRVVVMSATIDAEKVSAFLGGCPVIEIPGRVHPVTVEWRPGVAVADAVRSVAGESSGSILCFLPGRREIDQAVASLRQGPDPGMAVMPLHGSLDAEAQDAAIAPGHPRIIVATNIAETSLTVEGVTTVIDSGLQKVVRYDPAIGLDRLELERISSDSAEQRAGRAGRVRPGRVIRLWDHRDILNPHREPEILRVDLASTLLEVIGWGEDPERFQWFEPPDRDQLDAALDLLERVEAVERSAGTLVLTGRGRLLRRLPLHPRLGTLLLSAAGSRQAARACALLSEDTRGVNRGGGGSASDSDLFPMLDGFDRLPMRFRLAAKEFERLAGEQGEISSSAVSPEVALRRALLAGWPDRVAARREPGSNRFILASGHGAVLAEESGVRTAPFLVALDVSARRGGEALIRIASAVESDWLEPNTIEVVHRLDGDRVRAKEILRLDQLVLRERNVAPDPATAEDLLVEELKRRGELDDVVRRARFAGLELDLDAIFHQACQGRTSLPSVHLEDWLAFAQRSKLDLLAPRRLEIPSGRSVALDYREDGTVAASVKLQELFGLAESPRLGPDGQPVVFLLLAPNGRPVQTTGDLRSFWNNTYPDVRKELRGRYPKHPWPEDPWNAEPTARTRRRGK